MSPNDRHLCVLDGFHRGCVVQEGGERRVLRAHTYPTGRRYRDRLFSNGWWVSSLLNINRWFKSSTNRVLGDKIQETTTNRYQHDISKTPPWMTEPTVVRC